MAGGFDWVDARDVATGMMAAEAAGAPARTISSAVTDTRSSTSASLAAEATGTRRAEVSPCRWAGPVDGPGGALVVAMARDPAVVHAGVPACAAGRSHRQSGKAVRELGSRHGPPRTRSVDVYAWFRATGTL